jgi:type I restriction enzyme S subunit
MNKQLFNKNHWKKINFGDIVQEVRIAEHNPIENGIERYIGLEHIDSEDLHIKSWGNIKDGTTFSRKFIKGQLLFGRRRAYLKKAAIADFDGICSGDILVFEAIKGKLIPELLPFIVQNDRFFNFAVDASAGSLSPRVKFKDLAKFELTLPISLDEQKELADLLWSGDKVLQRYRELERELGIYLLSNIINQLDSVDGKVVKLFDTADFINGRGFKSSEWIEFGLPIIRIQNLNDVNAYFNYASEGYENKYLVKRGDILFSWSASIDIYKWNGRDAWLNQHIFKVVPNTNINQDYLFYLLKRVVLNLEDQLHGTTMKHVTRKTLSLIKVQIPDINTQIHIAKKLNNIEKSISSLADNDIANLYKSLINRIFG